MQQQLDRSVPLGEILVRMGVVSRDELQTALARKMGYPLVDLEAFPVETEALRKLGYGVAARLRAMPLLIRDGRLVVALEDPSRRAAVDEIEFNSELKVVPVLGRSIYTTLHAAYDKIGSGEQDARGRRPGGADRLRARLLRRLRGDADDDRRARRDAREGGPRAARPATTTSRSSRATTRSSACSTTWSSRRTRKASPTSTSRATPARRRSASASGRTASCAPTSSCRRTTATR